MPSRQRIGKARRITHVTPAPSEIERADGEDFLWRPGAGDARVATGADATRATDGEAVRGRAPEAPGRPEGPMRTRHQHDTTPLTPSGDARKSSPRAPRSAPPGQPPAAHTASSVTAAMHLLHRTPASGFMSLDERTYVEHRRKGGE